MTPAEVTTAIGGNKKTDYAIELCNDLRKDPALLAKVPATLTETITRLQMVQA